MINICDRYKLMNPKAQHLPLIYPLVIYNGIRKKYNIPCNIWDLFNDRILAKEFWTNDYQLVNLHEIPDEELKKEYCQES